MNKNIKNALLLSAVMCMSGSVMAAAIDGPDFSTTTRKAAFGGEKVTYTPSTSKAGKLTRSNSGILKFDPANYADDGSFNTAKAEYDAHMADVEAAYDATINHATTQANALAAPNKTDAKYTPAAVPALTGILSTFVNDENKDDADNFGKIDLGDGNGNKKHTWGEVRAAVETAQRDHRAQLDKAQKDADDLYNADLAAHAKSKAEWDYVIRKESEKKAEKTRWRTGAAASARKSARELYLDANAADKSVVDLLPATVDPVLGDVVTVVKKVQSDAATAAQQLKDDLADMTTERDTAQAARSELMKLLVQLEPIAKAGLKASQSGKVLDFLRNNMTAINAAFTGGSAGGGAAADAQELTALRAWKAAHTPLLEGGVANGALKRSSSGNHFALSTPVDQTPGALPFPQAPSPAAQPQHVDATVGPKAGDTRINNSTFQTETFNGTDWS